MDLHDDLPRLLDIEFRKLDPKRRIYIKPDEDDHELFHVTWKDQSSLNDVSTRIHKAVKAIVTDDNREELKVFWFSLDQDANNKSSSRFVRIEDILAY